jgi:hypothetical protein
VTPPAAPIEGARSSAPTAATSPGVSRARLEDRDVSGKIVMRIAPSVTVTVTATNVTSNTATAQVLSRAGRSPRRRAAYRP